MFTLSQLIGNIKKIYLQKDVFEMHKNITDFHDNDGEYIGDYFNLFIQERMAVGAPKFYHIGGPFDLISKKAPQRVTVYQNGELLLNRDITHEINVRTAAMNFVVWSSLGMTKLSDKKILLYGTGNIGKEFLKQLKEYDPEVQSIDCVNTRGKDDDFSLLGSGLGIACNFVKIESLSGYDIIILLTTSRNPVINEGLFATAKENVVMMSFTSGEIAGGIYSQKIQMIVDREQTLKDAKDIKEQMENGILSRESIIILEELLNGNTLSSNEPILYRSTGAPMQSLAIVQLLQ